MKKNNQFFESRNKVIYSKKDEVTECINLETERILIIELRVRKILAGSSVARVLDVSDVQVANLKITSKERLCLFDIFREINFQLTSFKLSDEIILIDIPL